MINKKLILFAFAFIFLVASVSAANLTINQSTTINLDQTSAGQNGFKGMKFTVGSKDIYLISATKHADTQGVLNLTNSARVQIATTTFSGNIGTFATPQILLAGQTYYIGVSLANQNVKSNLSVVNYPITTQYVTWVTGFDGGSDNADTAWGITNIVFNVSVNPVTLVNPPNGTALMTTAGQWFNATYNTTIAGTGTAVNSTRFIYTTGGALVRSDFTDNVAGNKSNFSFVFLPPLSDGTYLWASHFGADTGVSAASENFTFSLDSTVPIVRAQSPANNSYIYSTTSSAANFSLLINATDSALGSCYFNSTFNSAITLTACNATRQVNLTNTFGKHTLYVFANDTSGNTVMNQTTIWIHRNVFENLLYETESKIFALELWNMTSAPTTAVLNYSGTNYSGTITSLGNGLYNITRRLAVPAGIGTNNFSWWFTDAGTQKQSNSLSTTVHGSFFTICNATINHPFLNISFKNETNNQEVVGASLASSSFTYYIGEASANKTYITSSSVEAKNYTFCFTPQNRTVNVFENINYANSVSPQRNMQATLALTNATVNQTLYLLPTSVGITVTFQLVNNADQPLEGVTVNVSSSTFGSIETRTTDASGTATFFLNPLTAYTVVASKTDYTTFSSVITPTQSEYTITLGGGGAVSPVADYFRGIDYTIRPTSQYLVNGTSYNFNFTLSSSYWALDEYGFTLRNSSGSVFGTSSDTTSSGGVVTLTRNTGENVTLIVNAYWVIGGNYTNVTKIYTIFDGTGTDTSLSNLRDRITLYINNGGIFGLTAFGLNIIVFLIIMTVTGIASYKYGISSPAVVFGIMFFMTVIFDYMNLITYSANIPIDNAASFVIGLVTFAFGIKEAVSG